MIAVREGERPRKPDNAESLGFPHTLWWLLQMCWSESPSARPTAQQLLLYLEDASRTWVPQKHPISHGLEGGGLDLPSDGEWSMVTSALTSSFLSF